MANVVDLAFMEAQEEAESDRQREVVRARLYHSGEHPTFLTDRMRKFLAVDDDETKFNMNVTRGVVEAVTERLIVSTINSPDKTLSDWAWLTWQANKMSARQFDVYEAAVRDGEAFVIVDWDAPNARPRWTLHQRYADTEVEGDGFGCVMVYPDNDPNQEPEYAVKFWTETGENERGEATYSRRATLYYPERVERYIWLAGGWKPYQPQGEAWPLAWVTKNNDPLGIAVVHFQNTGLRCEAWDAIPIQDGINKSLIDLLASADAAGFPMYKALGFVPTTDGKALTSDLSNALAIEPGVLIGTTKNKNEADIDVIQPGNLTPLLELTQQLVMWLAVTSNTPLSRFASSGQIAAEGTLKQQSEPLIAKVQKKQELFADAWEQCLDISRRLAILNGVTLDETADMEVLWKPIEKRAQADMIAEWQAKREQGIPQEQIWSEMGYSQEQISTMKAMPDYQARMALMQAGMGTANG